MNEMQFIFTDSNDETMKFILVKQESYNWLYLWK